jgi:iron complex outermembrane receptor protein
LGVLRSCVSRRGAACLWLCVSVVPAAAAADAALDEVIVTARKVREPLADVPLAVRVVSSEELRRAGIDGMQALSEAVPGLYFESMWGGSNAAPTLRGQAQPNQGGNNVGVFVDGVYQASNTGLDTSMLDLDRIEVVEGPQSSLYGRSTFSRAINYITHRPTDVVQGEVFVDGGTQNYRSISAALSGPLTSSGVALRAAASVRSFDGTGTNLANPGDNLGGYRKEAVSLAASFTDSGWDVLASAHFSEDQLEQPAASSLTATDYNCGSRDPQSGEWTYFCGNAPRTDRYDISPGIPDSTTRTLQVALHVRRESGDWSAESLSSYYRSTSDVYQDYDVSSAGELYGVCTIGANCDPAAGTTATLSRTVDVNQVALDRSAVEELTQELRLHYREGRLQATVGALIAANRSTSSSDLGATPSTPLGREERLTDILPGAP